MGHLSKHVIRADVDHGRTDLCTGLGHMPHSLAVHAMRLRFRMFCSIHSGERRRVNHHVGTVAVQGLDHSSCIAHIEVALAEPHHLHLGSRNRALEQPCAELACGAGHKIFMWVCSMVPTNMARKVFCSKKVKLSLPSKRCE